MRVLIRYGEFRQIVWILKLSPGILPYSAMVSRILPAASSLGVIQGLGTRAPR